MSARLDFLAGGQEMSARMRAADWAATPLGAPETWPESLRSALGICLGSRFPIAICWGDELRVLYNDAWSPILGSKHPRALGRPALEVWPEIWSTIGPLFHHVRTTGESTYAEDGFLPMRRHGYTEECYFNFTFTPIRGAGGRVEGVFNAVIETTFRVISERRTRVLRELSERLSEARSTGEACRLAADALGAADRDVAFCALYLVDAARGVATLAGLHGLEAGHAGAPLEACVDDGDAPWPFREAAASGQSVVVSGLSRLGLSCPGGAWPEPAEQAIVAPTTAAGATAIPGFLVLGASPRRSVDDEYRHFAERAAAHVGRMVSATAALVAERRRAEGLAELDRAKTVFFSNVSHEFRTPLMLTRVRNEAVEALKASEERYRAVLESLSELVCRFHPEGGILFANPAYARSLGTTPEALVGRRFWDFIPQDDQPAVRAALASLTPSQPEVRVENRFRTTGGERWMLWTNRALAFDDRGRVVEAQSTGVDITDRKLAEQALEEEAQTLEILNRTGRMLAAENDLERLLQAVTDAATSITGAQFGAFFYNVKTDAGEAYSLFTLSGAPREAFERFGMPRNTAIFRHTFEGRGPVRLDDVTKDPRYGQSPPHYGMPEGHLPVRSYLAVPVVSRSGEVLGGLFLGHRQPGVFTERAERLAAGIASQAAVAVDNARLLGERAQLIEQLRESDRRKDEFLATLSHELRNPLAPLRNALELLRMNAPGDEMLRRVHDLMGRQVNHLVRLVDDLLEVSRISRGNLELRRERIELSSIVSHALETSDPLIRAGGHRLEVRLPPEALCVDGDPVRLAQILSNLLNNAAEYTNQGGRIAVEARREGDTAVVTVEDNGRGIAPGELPRLFDMFVRGEAPGSRRQGGLGIGLTLARRLAELHGGTLKGASAGLGLGSRFTLRLPLVPAPDDARAGRSGSEAPLAQRVLVVDDNRDAADSLAAMLELLGAEVHVAYDGREALECFARARPEVVLLDIGMPDIDGYSVAREIHARHPGHGARLIALTGWGQERDRREARDAGFDHHLIKPAEMAALEAVLRGSPSDRSAS